MTSRVSIIQISTTKKHTKDHWTISSQMMQFYLTQKIISTKTKIGVCILLVSLPSCQTCRAHNLHDPCFQPTRVEKILNKTR